MLINFASDFKFHCSTQIISTKLFFVGAQLILAFGKGTQTSQKKKDELGQLYFFRHYIALIFFSITIKFESKFLPDTKER